MCENFCTSPREDILRPLMLLYTKRKHLMFHAMRFFRYQIGKVELNYIFYQEKMKTVEDDWKTEWPAMIKMNIKAGKQ